LHHIVGFGVTLAILKQLIKPIEFAGIESYKEETSARLPLVFHDEAGFNA
jgi:hypothetical protein